MNNTRTLTLAAVALAGCLNYVQADDDSWRTLRQPQLAQPSGSSIPTSTSDAVPQPQSVRPQASKAVESAQNDEPTPQDSQVAASEIPVSAIPATPTGALPDVPAAAPPESAETVPEVRLVGISETSLAGTQKDASADADFNSAALVDSLPWLPILDDIIQPVSFSQSTGQSHSVPGFEAKQTPFLGVRSSGVNATEVSDDIFGITDLRTLGRIDLGEAQDLPTDVHGSFVNDLQTLVGEDRSGQPDESYLADLNQLLGGESNWVMTSGAVLDLDPHAPKPTSAETSYMHELQKLVQSSPVASRADYRDRLAQRLVSLSTYAAAYQKAPVVPELPSNYYEIPAQADCTEVGGNTVADLFRPLSDVHVGGVSSAPPQAPKNAEERSLKLAVPTNLACNYMELDAPGYYFTTGYGPCRAPRNTHPFCHNPLYYEDPDLERCGQSEGCLTTALSAAHFGTMIAVTPYLMASDHPRSCVRALPDCPTCHSFGADAYFPEWSWKAATVQAAAVTGLIFIIP